jgi:two-component system, OmpR family, phosphate regulon sensor histidine kinase PhoR
MSDSKPSRPAISFALILAFIITGLVFVFDYFQQNVSGIFYYLPVFLVSSLLIAVSYRILYRRFIFQQLKVIYDMVFKLRHPGLPVPVKDDDADLAAEIRRLLNDWNAESREEIDQLKQVENYRRDFLSNVSHELKTPIFSIQGYIHTLLDGGIEDEDINLLYLNKASKSTDRLISIVDDLEAISRIESGMLVVEERTFDMTELVKEVIDSIELQAKEKKVQFALKDDKPHYVFADKDMIRQVLVNLLVNSVKYGKLEGVTEVRMSENNDLLVTEVADNGIGIEPYHLKRLFERFYRVDKSRSRDQGGTGLGLAIVKHIMEAHRQQITVESEYGQGTTFSFTLRKSK